MADITTTLHPENNPDDNLYPNIKKENIPDNAIDIDMLDRDVDYVVATTKNNAVGKYNVTMQGGYLTPQNVYVNPSTYHSITSVLIPCNENEVYYYKGYSLYNSAYAIFFDKLGNMISNLNNLDSKTRYTEIIIPSGASYVKFSSYDYLENQVVYNVYKKDSVYDDVINNNFNSSGNILQNKKYVACGDSFTAIGADVDSYPFLIAKRNGMNLVNMGRGGSYAHYADTNSSFTNTQNHWSYVNIPTDADYISIAYGLNEINVNKGDYTSSDNTTIWGAFNEILNWIITNIPQAKILIIANDAWFSYSMRDTMRDIAHYWGVGFLDLKGADVPLMIGGKYPQDGFNVNPHAVELYNSYYQVSPTDAHPNVNSRKARSTIIESALRKL